MVTWTQVIMDFSNDCAFWQYTQYPQYLQCTLYPQYSQYLQYLPHPQYLQYPQYLLYSQFQIIVLSYSTHSIHSTHNATRHRLETTTIPCDPVMSIKNVGCHKCYKCFHIYNILCWMSLVNLRGKKNQRNVKQSTDRKHLKTKLIKIGSLNLLVNISRESFLIPTGMTGCHLRSVCYIWKLKRVWCWSGRNLQHADWKVTQSNWRWSRAYNMKNWVMGQGETPVAPHICWLHGQT